MKIIFEHVFGGQTDIDIQHFLISAIVSPEEEKMAVEHGWLCDQLSHWYQCRSVRIELTKYTAKKKIPKCLTFKFGL